MQGAGLDGGRRQGGKGAGRSSGKKSVKSSARTSRKRQPFDRPLAKIYNFVFKKLFILNN